MWEVLSLPRCSRMRVEMFPRRNRHYILHKWIYARHANGDGTVRDPSHLQIKNNNSRTWNRKLAINTSWSFAPIFSISLCLLDVLLSSGCQTNSSGQQPTDTNPELNFAFAEILKKRRQNECQRRSTIWLANTSIYVSNGDFCLIGW